jgi:hypothetical protein
MPTEEHPILTQRYLPLGTNLTICQFNVEGFSSSKSDYLARLMLEVKIDVIAVQDTHTASAESLRRRGNLTIHFSSPASISWSSNPLKISPHPAIYVGDFNSHNQQWGYDHNDVDGNLIHEWMTLNSLHLIYHPKNKGFII